MPAVRVAGLAVVLGGVLAGPASAQEPPDPRAAVAKTEANWDRVRKLRGQNLTTEMDLIEECVVPVFSRLNALCTIFGCDTPSMFTISNEDSTVPKTISQARQQLFTIVDEAFRFDWLAASQKIEVDLFIERHKHWSRLEIWRTNLTMMLNNLQHHKPNQDMEESVNLLLLQHRVVYVWIGLCTAASEWEPELFTPDFEHIIDLAARIIASRGAESTKPQPFSFEMQLIGPLYWVGVNCRALPLRRHRSSHGRVTSR